MHTMGQEGLKVEPTINDEINKINAQVTSFRDTHSAPDAGSGDKGNLERSSAWGSLKKKFDPQHNPNQQN